MSEQNPYEAPVAKVESTEQMGGIAGTRAVPIGNGASWYATGWDFFVRDPWLWILIALVFYVLQFVIGNIPILSIVLIFLLAPIFEAGMMYGVNMQDKGYKLDVSHLFAGFKNNTGPLIGLGAILMLVSYIIIGVLVAIFFSYASGLDSMEPEVIMANPNQLIISVLLPVLILLLFIVPIVMLFWYSPLILILNQDISVFKAMQLSFMGCVKNVLPFLLFGIISLVLMSLASIPLFLGWLIFKPIFFAAIYASYKDIFLDQVPA